MFSRSSGNGHMISFSIIACHPPSSVSAAFWGYSVSYSSPYLSRPLAVSKLLPSLYLLLGVLASETSHSANGLAPSLKVLGPLLCVSVSAV